MSTFDDIAKNYVLAYNVLMQAVTDDDRVLTNNILKRGAEIDQNNAAMAATGMPSLEDLLEMLGGDPTKPFGPKAEANVVVAQEEQVKTVNLKISSTSARRLI
ncbi:hypothetical protein FALBO_1594 [Fusarium albosuccineum]|uniref:Uncharacterized protein n=1 Tax=Fusarium albosuccineum TaxID=1237068 RepID=A0A8H4LLC2_9HYPO|nr:hypothetical protein FALBO_1594 [Fusarium albosuccineum]